MMYVVTIHKEVVSKVERWDSEPGTEPTLVESYEEYDALAKALAKAEIRRSWQLVHQDPSYLATAADLSAQMAAIKPPGSEEPDLE